MKYLLLVLAVTLVSCDDKDHNFYPKLCTGIVNTCIDNLKKCSNQNSKGECVIYKSHCVCRVPTLPGKGGHIFTARANLDPSQVQTVLVANGAPEILQGFLVSTAANILMNDQSKDPEYVSLSPEQVEAIIKSAAVIGIGEDELRKYAYLIVDQPAEIKPLAAGIRNTSR